MSKEALKQIRRVVIERAQQPAQPHKPIMLMCKHPVDPRSALEDQQQYSSIIRHDLLGV
jgi:hypothetical protein